MDTTTRLEAVIQHFGSVAKLADAIGCKPQAIYMWHGRIPQLRAYQIEALTKGKFKARDLLKPGAA